MTLTLPTIKRKANKIVCSVVSPSQMQHKPCAHANDNTKSNNNFETICKNVNSSQKIISTRSNDDINNYDDNNNEKDKNAFGKHEGNRLNENSSNSMPIEVEKSRIKA